MPLRSDLGSILVLGSGPIVIGQACEFDYSGSQALKALRELGFRTVLVNSNPASIMTDPEMADRTYIEPLVPEVVERVVARERPDAILPTVGGQTAINLAVALAESGVLDKYGVELIGAKERALRVAEDRRLFKAAMEEEGLPVLRGAFARSLEEALEARAEIGYPAIVRPSFTLGGEGGGTAYNDEEFAAIVARGLDRSPTHEVLVEESVIGWKEFELEVMRDLADNVVVICSIENFDPMGVHTGDSITVAPAQTLTDREYQRMRDMAARVIRKVGVETGGSNIQFAVHPETGRTAIIEMNPRVSRSSALASKATGFPIAKIAAKLAVGLRLDEIANDITRRTPASFEPTIDYVVVKIPRWAFEKFPAADPVLGTQMKSVGEAMAIGATFQEALQKGMRSLELGFHGLSGGRAERVDPERLRDKLVRPQWDRLLYLREALRRGMRREEIAGLTGIDPWFLAQIEGLVAAERDLAGAPLDALDAGRLREAKRQGFSDDQLARLAGSSPQAVRERRAALGVRPVYHRVDTCAAEFESHTPYLYSTYGEDDEAGAGSGRKVLILGGGPNRIGQGIEFDYCCCHASFALREEGFETIMVNCNPETVSTDYDTSSRLYFEPLTLEDVLNVVEAERPEGVIVQFGGQTPLNMALALEERGVPVLGTSPRDIDLAEDRERFSKLLTELGIPQPRHGHASSFEEAERVASAIGYPVLVRPSYVLGGRAMTIAYEAAGLRRFMAEAVQASPDHPVLIDQFLEDAFEIDVDAVADGERVVVGGIMQHIEEAGIHSGDSACVLPPFRVSREAQDTMREHTRRLALALRVRGLMNVQYAIKDGVVYVLEVNPRASRTVPFVSKAIGRPLAKIAAKVAVGRSLAELGFTAEVPVKGHHVKAVVFPFAKFPGVDTVLGPEMRSTGEVMGSSPSFGQAFAKAMLAAGSRLPRRGTVFLSVNNNDKPALHPVAEGLHALGFRLVATRGTAEYLQARGLAVEPVLKVAEGRPNVVDLIRSHGVDLVINTPLGREAHADEGSIRRAATQYGVVCITTLSGAAAAVDAVRALQREELEVESLQEHHGSEA